MISVGGCQLVQFHYTEALAAFVEARGLALASGASEDLGAIAVNLSSVYLQVWDVPSALRAAEDGLAEPARRGGYSRPHLLLQAGKIHSLLGDGRAEGLLVEGIEAARQLGLKTLEAQGWDLLGEEALRAGRLAQAERALGEAYRLRRLGSAAELGLSYFRFAALRVAEGDPEGAGRFNTLAANSPGGMTSYLLDHQRGDIRLAAGDRDGAIRHYAAAVDVVSRDGLQGLPTRAALVTNNIALDERIFRSYITLAAKRAVETSDVHLARNAFRAVEVSRAASLRSSLALADAWRVRLPRQYWATLEELAQLEAKNMHSGDHNPAAERLRLKLSEMEAKAGGGLSHKKIENFRGQSSLIHFQAGLRDSELLLSFWLGKSESYLWAVSRESFRMYRLPPQERVAAEVRAFREAVRTGGSEAERLGEQLYRTLFGQLAPPERAKRAWLFSVEDVLFEAPFAALVTERRNGNTVYLVEQHSLQTIPGAQRAVVSVPDRNSAGARTVGHTAALLAVGDPVYNTADPRWPGLRPEFTGGQLDRLVATAAEVSEGARAWRSAGGTASVLTGNTANRARFLRAIGEAQQGAPAIIHLATHVLASPARPERGYIAFSLTTDGAGAAPQPGFLQTSEIAALHVPGALVVMTGCATGAGDARSGAGLLGLTRAWLMAGASGVISTAWPVEDSAGEIFSLFYRHLSENSPEESLRLSQLGMIRSGTWRRAPSYWAAYQFTSQFTGQFMRGTH